MYNHYMKSRGQHHIHQQSVVTHEDEDWHVYMIAVTSGYDGSNFKNEFSYIRNMTHFLDWALAAATVSRTEIPPIFPRIILVYDS